MNGINITLTQADFYKTDNDKLSVKENTLLNCIEIDPKFYRKQEDDIMYFSENGYWKQITNQRFSKNIRAEIIKKAHIYCDENFDLKYTKTIENLRVKIEDFPSVSDIKKINADGNFRVITKSKVYNIHSDTAEIKVVENVGQYYNFVALDDFTIDLDTPDNKLLHKDVRSFLSDMACNDTGLVSYLQELMGHTLVHGSLDQPYIYILYGAGKNGKSVFIELLNSIVGDKSTALNFSDLTLQTMGALEKNFINSPSELDGNKAINESALKAITSGDPIAINEKYLTPRTIRPIAKQIAAANTLPPNLDGSDGLWRRIQIVPFFAYLKQKKAISRKTFEKLFSDELEHIQQWAFRGLLRMIKNNGKHSSCQAVEQAVKQYKFDENSIFQYLSEVRMMLAEDSSVELANLGLDFSKSKFDSDVYTATITNLQTGYKNWTRQLNIKKTESQKFRKKLAKLNVSWLDQDVQKGKASACSIDTSDLRYELDPDSIPV